MIILASASPRRQELLRNAGIAFTVQPANIDERPLAAELPLEHAQRLAREKALAVHKHRPDAFVLGADTIVVIDQMILGKPRDQQDATRILRLLSGRQHTVITGVCLVKPALVCQELRRSDGQKSSSISDQPLVLTSEITLVTMANISDEEIRDYIATGEPMDKAGAYGIQGIASRWVTGIEGDYSNVVGLPVARVYEILRETKAL